MLARSLPKVDVPTASTSALPPALPGLVSSLRPIKRLANQLADEATLLSRFTYKNKNQHKGNGWWRRVVEVDRVVNRLVGELGALLDQFGVDVESKQEIGLLSEHTLVPGLIRLPRASALVDKTLSVLLGASSILEQLVDSRAFLAFALVVVALISRLHAITTVLSEELAKAASVLVRLVKSNKLLPALTAAYKRLPHELRRFIPLAEPAKPTPFPSASTSAVSTRHPSPIPVPRRPTSADDLGAPVSRDELLCSAPKPVGSTAPVRPPKPRAPSPTPQAPTRESATAGLVKKKKRVTDDAVVAARQQGGARAAREADDDVGPIRPPERAAASPAPSEWSVLPPPAAVPPPPQDQFRQKKKRVEASPEGDAVAAAPPKKKKRRPKAGDEIDDIFG